MSDLKKASDRLEQAVDRLDQALANGQLAGQDAHAPALASEIAAIERERGLAARRSRVSQSGAGAAGAGADGRQGTPGRNAPGQRSGGRAARRRNRLSPRDPGSLDGRGCCHHRRAALSSLLRRRPGRACHEARGLRRPPGAGAGGDRGPGRRGPPPAHGQPGRRRRAGRRLRRARPAAIAGEDRRAQGPRRRRGSARGQVRAARGRPRRADREYCRPIWRTIRIPFGRLLPD